jgi:ABC-2 type transport system permease protein
VPVEKLPSVLESVANVLPLTYAVDAMQHVSRSTSLSGDVFKDLAVVTGFALVALLLGAATLRRKTK